MEGQGGKRLGAGKVGQRDDEEPLEGSGRFEGRKERTKRGTGPHALGEYRSGVSGGSGDTGAVPSREKEKRGKKTCRKRGGEIRGNACKFKRGSRAGEKTWKENENTGRHRILRTRSSKGKGARFLRLGKRGGGGGGGGRPLSDAPSGKRGDIPREERKRRSVLAFGIRRRSGRGDWEYFWGERGDFRSKAEKRKGFVTRLGRTRMGQDEEGIPSPMEGGASLVDVSGRLSSEKVSVPRGLIRVGEED